MDKVEAAAILKSELAKYRERSYHSLQNLLTDLDAYEVRGPSGKFYQLEVQVFWDGEPNGNLLFCTFNMPTNKTINIQRMDCHSSIESAFIKTAELCQLVLVTLLNCQFSKSAQT